MYAQGRNSVFQTSVISSWSDLKGENVQVSAGFNIFPSHFQKRKPSKNLGLNIDNDLGINSIPQIKDRPGLFELFVQCFS